MKTGRNAGRRGFALLVAVIFMSVMLTFGLALGSLGYKQQVLTSSALMSQTAFYAADAALECALYADQKENLFAYDTDLSAPVPTMTCDGEAPYSVTNISHTASIWITSTELSLNSGKNCAVVTIYKPASTGTNYVFAQGYSISCATLSGAGDTGRFSTRGIEVKY